MLFGGQDAHSACADTWETPIGGARAACGCGTSNDAVVPRLSTSVEESHRDDASNTWCFWWITPYVRVVVNTNGMLRTGEAARRLGVSRQHVVDLCNQGRLPYITVGAHRRIPEEALNA